MSLRHNDLDAGRQVQVPVGNTMHHGIFVSMEKNEKRSFAIIKRPFSS